MAGNYAGTSVKNYVNGIRAWHIIHGIEWNIDQNTLDTMIKGAERLRPVHSRQEKRHPFTVSYITQILTDFNPTDPFDVACAACLTTSFYCIARVGELTVLRLQAFSPDQHITPMNIRRATDRNGFETTVLHVPRTKSSQIEGEDLYFSKQLGSTNPELLLQNHLALNRPEPSEHLFTYSHGPARKPTRRPLTKAAFLQRVQKAAPPRCPFRCSTSHWPMEE
ncbi:hypothetical protein EV361DRAFT_886294 [Lentinula raphanica]|nr:hypothetical protein EV361DRAFT_886294 [Lentinula raphanica]